MLPTKSTPATNNIDHLRARDRITGNAQVKRAQKAAASGCQRLESLGLVHLDLSWVDGRLFGERRRRFRSPATLPSLINHTVHFAASEIAVSIEPVVSSAAQTKIARNRISPSPVRLDVCELEATSLFTTTAATVDEGAAQTIALEHLTFVGSADVT